MPFLHAKLFLMIIKQLDEESPRLQDTKVSFTLQASTYANVARVICAYSA